MPNTTNYNWATPADTDLVKDGAAAIRTLGSSADTTVKNLNPGTTAGDIDYYTSSTAKARIAIGTAGQVLKVNSGGTAPEWGTTADQTPLTTKGDLFTFDTADARLGVGANGTVLTADSAEATGLKWVAASGGDLVKISSVTWTAASAQSLTSVFSATYDNYLIVFDNLVGANSNDFAIRLRSGANNDTNATYYYANLGFTAGGSASNLGANTDDKFLIDGLSQSPHCTGITLTVFNPFESVRTNMIWTLAMGDSGAAFVYRTGGGLFAANTSFDGLGFFLTGGGDLSGDATVYGYKK
jgi:hypothetical protein